MALKYISSWRWMMSRLNLFSSMLIFMEDSSCKKSILFDSQKKNEKYFVQLSKSLRDRLKGFVVHKCLSYAKIEMKVEAFES